MIPELVPALVPALARSPGTLSDPTAEMRCRDVAAAVAEVCARLDGLGVPAADCIGFECANDLPSAIVLLALLAGGRRFVLLPPAPKQPGAAGDGGFADMVCRYRLEFGWRDERPGAAVQPMAGLSLAAVANPGWRAALPAGPPEFLVPSSGSTGRAKLVRHAHERLLLAATRCAARLGLGTADRVAIPVPIAHMFGLGAAFLPALLAGASVDLQPNANALRYFARERDFAPDVAFLSPGFAEALLRLRKAPRPYRLTIMAGDRVTGDLFDRHEALHGCLVSLYGSTEMGVIAAADPRDPKAMRRDTVGRLMPGVAVREDAGALHGLGDGPGDGPGDGQVRDRMGDRGRSARAGLLWFRSDSGFIGYVGDPVAGRVGQDQDEDEDEDEDEARGAQDAAAPPAWFCSNDIGRIAGLYLIVHGRGDDLVNRDGLLVSCGEVADALRRLPGIAEAVILAGEMTARGRALLAFCVARPGFAGEAAGLRRDCLAVLPPRNIPDRFVFLRELPRLASGKIDRMALRRDHVQEGADADGR